ncbi:MAG: hypothetical protein ABJH63_19390, partial [Rhizobiaceae bacterium]
MDGTNDSDFLVGSNNTNDTLRGFNGNDVYFFAPGFGRDVIQENGTAEDADAIVFGAGIEPEQ